MLLRKAHLHPQRAVNRKRKRAGYKVVPTSALRLRRRIVRPFEEAVEERTTAAAWKAQNQSSCHGQPPVAYDAETSHPGPAPVQSDQLRGLRTGLLVETRDS